MPKEYIANFRIENEPAEANFNLEDAAQDVHFTINEHSVNATFEIENTGSAQAVFSIEQPSGGDKYFVFNQSVSSDEWTIHHNLNKHAAITVVDEYDRTVDFAAEYVNDNLVILKFNCSFKGKAYLN